MPTSASEYVICRRRQETPTTSTLVLQKTDGTIPHYRPGQCLTVYFPDFSPTLGKQYSISSAPCEGVCAITVKAIGRFSNRLCKLSPGEYIAASNPQGTFYPTHGGAVMLLAGGMGVTPFRSIIVDTLSRHTPEHIGLYYSAHTLSDMPFVEELFALSKQHPMFHMERFVTKETTTIPGVKHRRMRAVDILGEHSGANEYLISGSLSVTLGLRNMLVEAGVSREDILTESYF